MNIKCKWLMALSAALVLAGGQNAFASPCVPSVGTNFCHATFDVNTFYSSTFTKANTSTAFTTTGATASGAAPSTAAATNNYGVGTSQATTALLAPYTTTGATSITTKGNTYTIDSTGQGAISLVALKNATNEIIWKATQAGPFSFNWQISGTGSPGSSAYVIVNNVATLLGVGPSSIHGTTYGSYTISNLTVGETFGFEYVGTTQSTTNTGQLQVYSFKGVPEINGGTLPLALLLLGLTYVAVLHNRSRGDRVGPVSD